MKVNEDRQPWICLRSISREDLQRLVNYRWHGIVCGTPVIVVASSPVYVPTEKEMPTFFSAGAIDALVGCTFGHVHMPENELPGRRLNSIQRGS